MPIAWIIAAMMAAASVGACATAAPDQKPCPECPTCEVCEVEAEPDRKAYVPYEAPRGSVSKDHQRKIEVLAFSSDGKRYALKITDELRGSPFFELRDASKGKILDAKGFDAGDEASAWRGFARKHDLEAELVETPENQQEKVTLVVAPEAEARRLTVYVMRDGVAVPYYRIPLLSHRDGRAAVATLGQIAWDRRGKYAVVVHTQRLDDRPGFESDFAHAFKLRMYRTPF